MHQTLPLPLPNDHVIGMVIKEIMRRAMIVIREERLVFQATQKMGYGGQLDDLVTSADGKAQDIYEAAIKECFPGAGIIGEEDLSLPCTVAGHDIYFTIDPLDGTKAFARRQSHGSATMIALVMDGRVVSAWIGDINTMEIYGYRPGSKNVHRISNLEHSEKLSEVDRPVISTDLHLLLRSISSLEVQAVKSAVSCFKDLSIEGGSIGTWFARLWKGEVGGLVMDPGHDTPWDMTPLIGISQKLGFRFLLPDCVDGKWAEYVPQLVKEPVKRDHVVLVIHEKCMPTLPH